MFRLPLVYFRVHRGRVDASSDPHEVQITEATQAFDHPRTMMGDYQATREVFTRLLDRLGQRGWYRQRPYCILHFPDPVEGGMTPVELRGFKEAALEAGCGIVGLMTLQIPPLPPDELERLRIFHASWWQKW